MFVGLALAKTHHVLVQVKTAMGKQTQTYLFQLSWGIEEALTDRVEAEHDEFPMRRVLHMRRDERVLRGHSGLVPSSFDSAQHARRGELGSFQSAILFDANNGLIQGACFLDTDVSASGAREKLHEQVLQIVVCEESFCCQAVGGRDSQHDIRHQNRRGFSIAIYPHCRLYGCMTAVGLPALKYV